MTCEFLLYFFLPKFGGHQDGERRHPQAPPHGFPGHDHGHSHGLVGRPREQELHTALSVAARPLQSAAKPRSPKLALSLPPQQRRRDGVVAVPLRGDDQNGGGRRGGTAGRGTRSS